MTLVEKTLAAERRFHRQTLVIHVGFYRITKFQKMNSHPSDGEQDGTTLFQNCPSSSGRIKMCLQSFSHMVMMAHAFNYPAQGYTHQHLSRTAFEVTHVAWLHVGAVALSLHSDSLGRIIPLPCSRLINLSFH